MKDNLRVATGSARSRRRRTGGQARAALLGHRSARSASIARIDRVPRAHALGLSARGPLFHNGFRRRVGEAIERVRDGVRGIAVLVGFPEYTGGGGIYNAAAL
jgi:hypothetical protein